LKITFIISTLEKGGTERVASLLANSLVEKGHEIFIMTLFKSNIKYNIDKRVNVVSLELEPNSKNHSLLRKFYNYIHKIFAIKKSKYFKKSDYVIGLSSDFINLALVMANFLSFLRKKIILTIRSNPLQARSFLIRTIIYSFYRFGYLIVVQTNFNKRFISKYVKKEKTIIIPNPIFKYFNSNQYFINKKKYNFLSVGRINSLKNYEYIINELHHFKTNISHDFKYVILGRDDGHLKIIKTQIKQLNLEDNIKIVGEVDDVVKYYNNCSFFIHGSEYEGMSNSILEAISFGIPTFSSDHDGVDEIIENNVNGILFDASKKGSLSDAITNLFQNQKKIHQISNNAFKSSKNYRLDLVLSKWNKILK